jgi:hypothetical protein
VQGLPGSLPPTPWEYRPRARVYLRPADCGTVTTRPAARMESENR